MSWCVPRSDGPSGARDNQAVRRFRPWAGMGVLVSLLTLVMPHAGASSSKVRSLSLVEPGAMVAAPDGGLYIYDTSRHQVLLRDPDGAMRVVAGNGVVGESGDGGLATR